jgi:hypothetical protein
MAHIVTTETRQRVNRPTKLGLHPAVAERLRFFGIDPEERSREIIDEAEQRRARKRLASADRLSLAARGDRRLITASLNPDDVRVAPLLNQVALMYEDNQYLADEVAPVQLETEKSAKYKIWDRGPFRSLLDSKIGPNGSAKEVAATLSEDSYAMIRRALKAFANNDTELANPTLEVRAMAVEQVMELHLVGREYDVATLFNTTGSYPGANVKTLTTGGGGTNWKQGSGAKPVATCSR